MIDADGNVAYYDMWAHAPNLHQAIDALTRQDDRGAVNGGIDHVVHLLPSLTHGWRGISRGLPQSLADMELATPGSGIGLWLGYQLRPALAPVTLRAKPLPFAAKGLLALGIVGAAGLAYRAARR